ncbi:MAG: MFS transporter [Gammaproteobacteria bacterium]|nr:MFS transporter [Gammaproteobacteria bacterium]MDH4253606.1 MFS transporter [Gammaproteobacteria bacterium]
MQVRDSEFSRELRQYWPVLALAFLCFLFAFSAPAFALPFLFPPVMEEFGWTREQVTLLASAKYATGAVFAIVVGRFIDVIGVRAALLVISALGGLALVSFLWTPNLAVYYLSGVLLGIAAPGTMVAVKVLISRSFHASQGTAMAVAMLGASVGSMLVPIVFSALIGSYGWRMASALLSLGIWFVAMPLLFFGTRDPSYRASLARSETRALAAEARSATLGVLIGRPEFWLIGIAVLLAGFVDQAFIQHQVLYLDIDLGMEAAAVAAGVSAIGAVGIVGRIVVGGVFDRWSARGVSAMYVLLSGSCLVALAAFNPWAFAAFVVLRAVGHSAVMLDTTVLTKHTFGLANIGVLLGVYTAMVNVGFALGPWVVARMYDASGSYTGAFLLCALLALVAGAILLPLRPSYWLRMREIQGTSGAGTRVQG